MAGERRAPEGGTVERSPLSLRRPRITLALAAAVALGLGILGLGVEERLKPTSLAIPGTESERASSMLRDHFGDSAPFAVLLSGPPNLLDAQGPSLIADLRTEEGLTTVSPWDRGGGVEELRPERDQALILVDFHVPSDEAVTDSVSKLEAAIKRQVSEPVRADASGFASVSRAIQERSIDATRRGV